MTVEIITGSGTWREVQYGDEADIFTIFGDWGYDKKRFTPRRAETAVDTWVKAIEVLPLNRWPIQPLQAYRSAYILHHQNGKPLACLVVLIRGSGHHKNPHRNDSPPQSILVVELFAISPEFRGQGRFMPMIVELLDTGFKRSSNVDLILYDIVDTSSMNAHKNDRTFDTSRTVKGKDGGNRTRISYSKESHVQRLVDRPNEANVTTDITDSNQGGSP